MFPPSCRIAPYGAVRGNATITTMDRDWMRERLEEFRAVCEEYERSSQHGSIGDENVRAHAPPGANDKSRAQGTRPGPRQLQP
jgi:hypothetical protein